MFTVSSVVKVWARRRGRAGRTRRAATSRPPVAAIAALSVHKSSGGMNSSAPSASHMSSSARTQRSLADTPPPTASRVRPVCRSACCAFATSTSTTACLKARRQVGPQLPGRRRAARSILPLHGVQHGRLQPAEAEVEPAGFEQRARKPERLRIAAARPRARRPGRRETEAEDGRDLVERLAGRVVERRAEQLEVERRTAVEQDGVAAADDQADAREDVAPGGEPAGVDVGLDVVDGRSAARPERRASILAALTPTSRAPTRPGVLMHRDAPISSSRTPAWRSASSMTGSSRCRWARAATSGTTPPKRACRSVCEATTLDSTRGSSVKTAAAVSSQEVSMARKYIIDADRRHDLPATDAPFAASGRSRRRLRRPLLPARALPEERQRVVVDDLADRRFRMAAALHLLDHLRHRQRVRLAPVAGRVRHDPLGADHLDDVHGPLRRALRRRVERHAAPEAVVEREPDRVLLDVVDQHALGLDAAVVLEHVDDHPRALVLVLQVGRVDQDQLVVFIARSTCSWKTVASLGVFLFRPISPMPSTFGSSRNSGIIAMTSRDSSTFSASLALMHSQE